MNLIINNKKAEIVKLCQSFNIKSLYVFGSAVRNDFRKNSDIDFLFESKNYPENAVHAFESYLSLQSELENLLGHKVDLIEYSQLDNPYLKHFINQEKVEVYAEA
jgi:predicted nucleotidyltransferase